jgi:hypothetical protein
MKRLTSLAGVAAAAVLSAAPVPAQADGMRSTNCIAVRGSLSCVSKWQRWDPQLKPQPTEQELAEARERERRWEARCRPALRHDNFGVARYVYFAPGCEFGQLD